MPLTPCLTTHQTSSTWWKRWERGAWEGGREGGRGVRCQKTSGKPTPSSLQAFWNWCHVQMTTSTGLSCLMFVSPVLFLLDALSSFFLHPFRWQHLWEVLRLWAPVFHPHWTPSRPCSSRRPPSVSLDTGTRTSWRGNRKGPDVVISPLAPEPGLRQPAVMLSSHTPCSLPHLGPGYLSHTVPGTANPGGRPSLWTQEFHKSFTGCAALAGPRPLSSRWSHGATSRARVSISRPGLCFSSRHSSLSWTNTWINWTWRSQNWKPRWVTTPSAGSGTRPFRTTTVPRAPRCREAFHPDPGASLGKGEEILFYSEGWTAWDSSEFFPIFHFENLQKYCHEPLCTLHSHTPLVSICPHLGFFSSSYL